MPDRRELLRQIYEAAARRADGRRVMEEVLARRTSGAPCADDRRPTHVLALGKVAGPMWEGLATQLADDTRSLLVTTEDGAAALARSPLASAAGHLEVRASDHPTPGARSEAAARAVQRFVASVPADGRLVVLLSGGASALLAAPAPGLSLDDKVALVSALARSGASIAALNVVRKHLSSVKGGRLALLCKAPVQLEAMADVLGAEDTHLLATVGSGPFSADSSTLDDARTILRDHGVALPPALAALWNEPITASVFETPKDLAAFAHVQGAIVARPADLQRWAEEEGRARGCEVTHLFPGTGAAVTDLADAIAAKITEMAARRAPGAAPLLLVGHGEPTLALPPGELGLGGRASHLAWEVARRLDVGGPAQATRVAFLAAASDDRDGSSRAHGACIDGASFSRARARGLDPAAAGARFDTARFFAALGEAIVGPGRSNLLDLHLALVG